MIKRSVQEEDITLANMYAFNIGAPKYIKQTDIREKLTGIQYNNSRRLLTPHQHQWTDLQDKKISKVTYSK